MKSSLWLSAATALAALVAPGCSGKMRAVLPPDHAPSVKLGITRVPGLSPDSVAFDVRWSATVSGATVDHFEWALDPAGSVTQWQRTTETHRIFGFRVPPAHTGVGRLSDAASHLLVVRTVDTRGRLSEPIPAELPLTNIPPTVQITRPIPTALLYAAVPDTILITWTGNDPDGVLTQKPVKYKFKLFKDTDHIFNPFSSGTDDFDFARFHGDSLRRFYEPTFVGWDSTSGEITSHRFSNLVPNSHYLFVVVAFDESGGYTQLFSRDTNMLQMSICTGCGPQVAVSSEFFSTFVYAVAGYLPGTIPEPQVPGNRPFRLQWSLTSQPGASPGASRWALDIADPADQTPRSDEATDWRHWSAWSDAAPGAATIVAAVQPGARQQKHLFYIDAQDSYGNRGLSVVPMLAVAPPFGDESSLLIVDDTRLLPDQAPYIPNPAHPDSVMPPVGNWPTAAELDTFLFARGGVRWRSTPDGTLSRPGIFAGYRFDTLSTRFLPGGYLPLSLLDQYRQIIWITEPNGVSGVSGQGLSLLRLMSGPGQSNPLAAWVKQGGNLWLVGSCGYASSQAWNNRANDVPGRGTIVFSSTPTPPGAPELAFGRLMHDLSHWQSAFAVTPDHMTINRSPRAVGGWPGAPNYGALPISIGPKTLANDPVPPYRSAATFFNSTSIMTPEYLTEPNEISESSESALDTLFDASGGQLLAQDSPCMTLYHGAQNGQVIVSGFNLWCPTRPDLIQLADFVLQQVWGLEREPIARGPASAPVAGRGFSQ